MPGTANPHNDMLLSASGFLRISMPIVCCTAHRKSHKRFCATFGMPPRLVALVWKCLLNDGFLNHLGPRSIKPVHLLWSLYFLRCYNIEQINGMTVGCDEKTFRKWAWFYAKCIAKLDAKYVSVIIIYPAWQRVEMGYGDGCHVLAVVPFTMLPF
jgi:hypothetical protein